MVPYYTTHEYDVLYDIIDHILSFLREIKEEKRANSTANIIPSYDAYCQ